MALLPVANLLHRKMRTAVAALAVALPVATVMLLVGLSDGTLNAIANRLQGVGADAIFQPPDSSLILGVSSAVMPLRMAELIAQDPHVTRVAPVLNWHVSQLKGEPESLNLWAIDYPSYSEIAGGFDLVAGRPLEGRGELVVDSILADARSLQVGEAVTLLDREFRIVGITRPGSGGRIFAGIDDIGEAIGSPGKASFFLVKGRNSREAADLVLSLQHHFRGYKVTAIAQVSRAIQENATGLRQFQHALMTLAVVISSLVVLLAMYTAILERTREIGILRAMGATTAFVLRAVLAESLLVSLLGVAGGEALALLGRQWMGFAFPGQVVELTSRWALAAGGLGLLGGLLGAAYPALRAARLDPITALSFE